MVATGDGGADLKIPDTAVLGFSYRASPSWRVNFDLDWTGWSAYDELRIETDLGDSTAPKDYEDTIAYRVGAEYLYSDNWSFRGGLLMESTPVPEDTYDGRLPDGDRIGYSIGAGYAGDRWTVDFAYMLVNLADYDVDKHVVIDFDDDYPPNGYGFPWPFGDPPDQTVDGRYEGDITLIGFNVGYRF